MGSYRTEPANGALEALVELPAFAPARNLLLDSVAGGSPGELATAVEADVGLTLAALVAASEHGTAASAREAVDLLGSEGLERVARDVPAYELFEAAPAWGPTARRLRMHSLAVRDQTARLARLLGRDDEGELTAAALLHDVGKVALPVRFPWAGTRTGTTPEQRLALEYEQFGEGHDRTGAALLARMGLPESLVETVARHHEARDGAAGIVRAADMLTHYWHARPVDVELLAEVSAGIGIDRDGLADLLYALPEAAEVGRDLREPCPLSERELQALRGLAEGKVYKQIATDLDVSASTVRSHLHRIYTRLGVADRTQAVITASRHGWI